MKSDPFLRAPSVTLIVALAIVAFAASMALASGIAIVVWQLYGANQGNGFVQLAGALVGGTVSFFGVALSGLVGLHVVRRDRYEQIVWERRSLSAALAGECSDISSVLAARAEMITRRMGKAERQDEINVDMAALPFISTAIYDGNTSRMGVLGPLRAEQTVLLYGRALAWKHTGARTMTADDWLDVIGRLNEISLLFNKHAKTLQQEAQPHK